MQEREGSQALSEDVPEPRRPPLPARKVVKKEEAPEQDSSVEDQPLKLTRRSVSVATSELPAAGPAAGPPGASLTRKVLFHEGNNLSTPANESILMPM